MLESNLKIIIVEDFNTIRLQITKMLNSLGFSDIHQAGDGDDAWTQIVEADSLGSPFGLIIADINMPVMNGIELLEKVRNNYENLPFIIITAENEKKSVIKALQLKVNSFIIKPITQDDLKERLLKIFNT